MERMDPKYRAYVQILNEELVPAMGCTEPIAVAYCAAKARALLGTRPEKVLVGVSGNMIKNAKSVVVPNTGGLTGIAAAAAAGIVFGDENAALEVIASVTPAQKQDTRSFLADTPITVSLLEDGDVLDILITLTAGEHTARARISGYHTNIVLLERDGKVIYARGRETDSPESPLKADRNLLTIRDIVDFADTVDLDDVRELIRRQIEYNTAIAEEGLHGDWGANIGSVILKSYGTDIKQRARAKAAAGSDARMSGCDLPVIINSGSGNQGITVSVPVIEYAREFGSSEDKLYRALILSNLIAIHQKSGIGRLSAYCGAVSAGCGAGCGIAYLNGGGLEEIAHTLVNAVAIVSGIVCDGAKPSCAAKIASAVDAGILGWQMFMMGQQFHGGEGLVSKGVENTLRNISRLGADGMRETDKEIIRIMSETR